MNILEEIMGKVEKDQNLQLFRAVVVANSGDTVQIQRTGQAAPDTQYYPKLDGVTVITNDEVLVARVGSGYIVLGKIVR